MKRISGEFFGKLGKLETHNTYPLQLPNHGAHRTAWALLLAQSPHPQDGQDAGQLVSCLAAKTFGKHQGFFPQEGQKRKILQGRALYFVHCCIPGPRTTWCIVDAQETLA